MKYEFSLNYLPRYLVTIKGNFLISRMMQFQKDYLKINTFILLILLTDKNNSLAIENRSLHAFRNIIKIKLIPIKLKSKINH